MGYRELVIADGAVHYWRLGEASGPAAADSIGGATGTITGAVTLGQPGALADGNNAMVFGGGKIAMTFSPIVQPCTIELWAKPSTASVMAFISTRDVAIDQGRFLLGTQAAAKCQTYVDSFGAFSVGASALTLAAWSHLVWVINANAMSLFINGAPDVLTPVAVVVSGLIFGAMTVGFEPAGGAAAWTGGVDEVAIYPTALSPAQITAHYAARTAPAAPLATIEPWQRVVAATNVEPWQRVSAATPSVAPVSMWRYAAASGEPWQRYKTTPPLSVEPWMVKKVG